MAAGRFKIPDEVEDAFNTLPETARDDLADLRLTQSQGGEGTATDESAMDLSIRLRHHLFDTLYDAVVLHTADATLVAADRAYYDKAHNEGRIVQPSRKKEREIGVG